MNEWKYSQVIKIWEKGEGCHVIGKKEKAYASNIINNWDKGKGKEKWFNTI